MSFFEKNYAIVRNCISKDMVNYIQSMCEIHRTCNEFYVRPNIENPYPFGDGQTQKSFAWYGAIHTDGLLLHLEPTISKVVGKKLLVAYSYTRTYFNGAELKKHIDRPSCEFSASLCIKKDSDWPLWIESTENDELVQNPIELECGDLVVYRGNILTHWRDPYAGEEHIQIFLHFVDSEGIYAESNYMDGRPFLGLGAKIRTNAAFIEYIE